MDTLFLIVLATVALALTAFAQSQSGASAPSTQSHSAGPSAADFLAWALPLGGILLGLRAYKRRLVLYQVSGTCPTCNEAIDPVGGSVDEPAWQACPKCKARLRLRPAV